MRIGASGVWMTFTADIVTEHHVVTFRCRCRPEDDHDHEAMMEAQKSVIERLEAVSQKYRVFEGHKGQVGVIDYVILTCKICRFGPADFQLMVEWEESIDGQKPIIRRLPPAKSDVPDAFPLPEEIIPRVEEAITGVVKQLARARRMMRLHTLPPVRK